MHGCRSWPIVVAALLAAGSARGQGVAVRGVVYDSLRARPLAGAFVSVGTRTATTDSAGRFSIDGIAPGTYSVIAQHDAVDRLGMSAIGTRATVTDGRDEIRVAVPSFASFWRQVCGPTAPAADTGFVFGTVRGPRRPAGVTVYASWIDLTATGITIQQKQRTLETSADSSGNFTLCGVPTSTGLSIRAAADSIESGLFVLQAMDKERIARRDLSLGTSPATM